MFYYNESRKSEKIHEIGDFDKVLEKLRDTTSVEEINELKEYFMNEYSEIFRLKALMKGFNPIQYGLFIKLYGMGEHYAPPPLVTLLLLKVEGQNLVVSGIFMCFFQKRH